LATAGEVTALCTQRTQRTSPVARSIDDFAPDAEVCERHEIVIDAPAELALGVAEDLDLLSIPPVFAIFWLRAKALGAPPPRRGDRLGLVDGTRRLGWRELQRRPGREVIMGAAVQPWLPEPVFVPVPADEFSVYAEPEHVKIVWTLEADPLGPGRCRVSTETRVVPVDELARRKFRRYWRFARAGIVLIRLLVLPAVRRQAERLARAGEPDPLDAVLPCYDATLACETTVDASPAVTYAAIRQANLLDPVVRALFAARELAARLFAPARGHGRPPMPRHVSVADFVREGTGMTLVSEQPGASLIVGSVGRFWERDYGHVDVGADHFADFDEPGHAKLAMGFSVRALPNGRTALRYEARTATTDEEARLRFRRYWMLIRPGVWLVMRRALRLIRREAEGRAADSR